MGEMRVMDVDAGDLKVIWDKDSKEEVKAAKDQFNSLLKKGYVAYKVDKHGEKAKQVKEFDPDLEKIILAPVVVGG